MHLLWSGGLSAHSVAHHWLLIAWAVFWFLILYGLLPLGVGLCLIVGFSSFSLFFYSFLSLATISCRITLPFLLWCYLTWVCWASLGLLLILLSITQYGHWIHTHAILGLFFYYIACGLLCPIYFFLSILGPFAHLLSLGVLGPFSNFAYPWASTNSVGLPWRNYLILHPWGS